MTGGLQVVVVVRLVWWVPLGREERFWFWLLLVSPLGGGGWEGAMLGGFPGGDAVCCSLSVGLTQGSAVTYLESLLHARNPSGGTVVVALLRGCSRL